MSAAAVMSASPVKFASATGMNIACRQVGGALGIAVMTVIVASRAGVDGYRLSYLVCGLCAMAAAVASMGFFFPRFAPKPPPRPEAAALIERTSR